MEISPIRPERSVLQELKDELFQDKGLQVFLKRDDLIHPQVSGNKWRKLKYNLQEAQKQGVQQILTFGGAYSNHILATAAAGKLHDFKTIGIIRGEEHLPLNKTLAFAKACNMELHYMNRQKYRQKNEAVVLDELKEQFPACYFVPEGGSNEWAVKGCAEIIDEIDIEFDYICSACGTGGTLAGLISGLNGNKKILGFPVLKGASFLYEDVQALLPQSKKMLANWDLQLDYHFGGYAKKKPELLDFIEKFQKQHQVAIEFVYTGKLFYGLYDLIKQGFFKKGMRIIMLHTGGLRKF